MPAASLSDDAPLYDRPRRRPARGGGGPGRRRPTTAAADLLALLRSPRWVYRQYDHQLFLNTVVGPGGDAALLRLAGPGLPPSDRGRGGDHRLQSRAPAPSTPGPGTALTLAEGVANLACVGATPVAVVNCLNFGNPEHPEVMWQLSECIDGMAEACRALGAAGDRGQRQPLQRERRGRHRPHAGARAARPGRRAARAAARAGLAGGRHPGPARAARRGRRVVPAGRDPLGHRAPAAPRRDAARPRPRRPRRACAPSWPGWSAPSWRAVTSRRCCSAVHDVSSGGLAVALAEMAVAAGTGCAVALDEPAELFTELPSRFVVATTMPDELCARADDARHPGRRARAGPAATASRWATWSTSRWRRWPRPTRAIWPACWGTREGAGLCENGAP